MTAWSRFKRGQVRPGWRCGGPGRLPSPNPEQSRQQLGPVGRRLRSPKRGSSNTGLAGASRAVRRPLAHRQVVAETSLSAVGSGIAGKISRYYSGVTAQLGDVSKGVGKRDALCDLLREGHKRRCGTYWIFQGVGPGRALAAAKSDFKSGLADENQIVSQNHN